MELNGRGVLTFFLIVLHSLCQIVHVRSSWIIIRGLFSACFDFQETISKEGAFWSDQKSDCRLKSYSNENAMENFSG